MKRNKRVAINLPDWAGEIIEEMAKIKNLKQTEIITGLITAKLNDMGYKEGDYMFKDFIKPNDTQESHG